MKNELNLLLLVLGAMLLTSCASFESYPKQETTTTTTTTCPAGTQLQSDGMCR
jgi:PBP1b-binding outer membrane lipoprotein LpoB